MCWLQLFKKIEQSIFLMATEINGVFVFANVENKSLF